MRYSFTDMQCQKIVDDAHKLVNDALQKVIGDVVPVVVDNIANSIVTLLEQKQVVGNNNNNDNILVEDTVLEDDSFDLAIKFMSDNSEFIRSELIARNQVYTNYVNTVATIDLYDEYLGLTPKYVPRKFRSDNRHCLSKDERDVVDRISITKFKGETELLHCRRDEFRRRIKKGDDHFEKFARDRIPNEEVLQEVMTAWKSALKVDEEKVDELQIKKTESLRNAHQKDRQLLQSRGTPSVQEPSAAGNVETSHQGMPNHQTPQGQQQQRQQQPQQQQPQPQQPQQPQHQPPQNSKNENSHRKKKKTRKQPHLASLTYLTSISNQRISVS